MYCLLWWQKQSGTRRNQVFPKILLPSNLLGDRILLVDDLVDSGISLAESLNWLKSRYPNISDLRTAVIWYKSNSIEVPDYYIDYLPNNPWIHQPFERYEQAQIHEFIPKSNRD